MSELFPVSHAYIDESSWKRFARARELITIFFLFLFIEKLSYIGYIKSMLSKYFEFICNFIISKQKKHLVLSKAKLYLWSFGQSLAIKLIKDYINLFRCFSNFTGLFHILWCNLIFLKRTKLNSGWKLRSFDKHMIYILHNY